MNDNVHSDPEAKAKVAFAKLRPVCVEVMRAPSLEALRALHEAVGRLDCIHPHLVEYIVLPLRMITRRSGSSNLRLLEATLDAFTAVFCRVKELSLESWEVFEELFGFMCLLLDTKMAAQAGYASCSEDLLLSVVRAMRALLLSLADSALARLHSRLPLLGHGVSVLLDVVGSQPAKALRAGAIGALLALSGRDDEEIARLAHSDDHCITAADPAHCLRALPGCVGVGRCGGAFASFLPGIAMALCKLVTMDTKVGQIALLAWAHFVSMVMADREATGLEDVPSGTHVHNPSTSSTNEQSLGEGKSLMVERTPTWQAETDSKLSILVQKMTSLVTRDGWRVRFTVVLWAHCLLTHCHRTLVTCMPAVLEVLVTLTHDDYQQVSSAARQAMELFSHEYAKEDSRQLTSMLEERLHALVSSLPRLMRQHDDARKVLTLQLLDGYLRLLGPHVISLVHSYPHLSRITQALLQTLTLEVGDTRIIEQPKMEAEEGKSGTGEGWRLPLKYHHFRSERIETLLHHACQLLGFYGSLPVLLDHLLDLFRGSTHYRKEVTIVIENVLVGAAGWGCVKGMGEPPHGVPPEQLYSLCEGVMEEMVTPEVWRGEERRNSGSTHPQEPTLLSCLLLVTITTVVKVMGQAFDRLLQLMIYPLMQQLGHSSAAVNSHALGTLRTVCSNCGYSSLEQLITHNADYLVNHVSLQLRTGPTRHPEALLVLQAMFRYGEEAVLPLMRDSVEELFLSLDLREDPALLWPALHTLALATARWTAGSVTATVSPDAPPTTVPEKKVGRPHPPEERLRPSPREIQDFFLEYHKCKERERLTGIEEDDEQQNAGAAEQEEDSAKPRPIPAHQLAMEVLQRCAHYLASPAPTLRLTVLDTLGHCLLSLGANETALLPEVHKVWPAFLHRLSDSTPSVAVRAWGVLLVMVEVCREFLRRRVVKEVWPHLIGQLESLATKSTNPDKLYRQTANFKLQRKLLECVGILCEHLDIRSSDEEQLAHACVPYLSTEQPDELRKTCQTSLIPLVRRDPDRMWLLLQQLRAQEVTVPPHRSLKPYKFAAFPSSSKFTDDATALLELTM